MKLTDDMKASIIASALQGVCANPAHASLDAERLGYLARGIAREIIAQIEEDM